MVTKLISHLTLLLYLKLSENNKQRTFSWIEKIIIAGPVDTKPNKGETEGYQTWKVPTASSSLILCSRHKIELFSNKIGPFSNKTEVLAEQTLMTKLFKKEIEATTVII